MTKSKTKYSEQEILEIFKEQHRLCSPLDPEADSFAEIKADMSIQEWRWANDLVGWKKLGKFLNREFRLEISEIDWYNVLEPADERKLEAVCELISKNAQKNTYEPKVLFGRPCLEASVFLTIKKNLQNKGVATSGLKPSSSLSEYMTKYFSPVVEEITLTGGKLIDKIEIERSNSSFWSAINIFNPSGYNIRVDGIRTFRDLTEKILELKS